MITVLNPSLNLSLSNIATVFANSRICLTTFEIPGQILVKVSSCISSVISASTDSMYFS